MAASTNNPTRVRAPWAGSPPPSPDLRAPERDFRPDSLADSTDIARRDSVQVNPSAIQAVQERRRRRRAAVPPMYTQVLIRVLSRREAPLEGHIVDISENGLAVEVDSLIPIGQAVTVEFQVSGLGMLRNGLWAEYSAAAEVVRHDRLDDFPGGPYRIALRFVQISTMTQGQIARFVATQPD